MNRSEHAILIITILWCCIISWSCHDADHPMSTLYSLQSNADIGVTFVNELNYTEELNTYTYRNFYNGGGVGIGDFNNDGYKDFYLTGNLVDNHLYINNGDWTFTEIATKAGVACPGVWSTGVSIADINQDGWEDIYVCKSGPPGGVNRRNELFINNGDLTFTEAASEYGIDDLGLSTHAAFFDMDKDGDLDCYLLNNSLRSVGNYDLIKNQREIRDTLGGNKLYRNDGSSFTEVSGEAGIYTSEIGFGLGVTVGDLNGDNWPDIYVSNDYFEKDYLYYNQQDGTFKESIESSITELSLSSMGADMADLNNDGYPEIFVTDMLPHKEQRLKSKTTFDDWDKSLRQFEQGYGWQYTRNTLQLNNGDGSFSEVGRYSGVYATDWSWGALIFDMDLDGQKDIFVANGLYKDLTDQDYINFIGDAGKIREMIKGGKEVIKTLVDSIPSEPQPNAAFINKGELKFENRSEQLGLGRPSFSNGAVFSDLDNDGDLDLIINNVNEPPHIYKNLAEDYYPSRQSLVLRAQSKKGIVSMNAKAKVFLSDGTIQFQEVMPMRSYMSTTDSDMHFGIPEDASVDSVVITWPDNRETLIVAPVLDTVLVISSENADRSSLPSPHELNKDDNQRFKKSTDLILSSYRHTENSWSDFDRQPLIYEMTSNEGPCICSGDINNDDISDVYIGGAKGSLGQLYVSNSNGRLVKRPMDSWTKSAISEDVDCVFGDFDLDGWVDLYVASGGNELPSSSSALDDRLYLNNEGDLKLGKRLPFQSYMSSSVVKAADFDEDGDLDLFIGERQKPFKYGVPCSGVIFENTNGIFKDVTADVAPSLINVGMITDAHWLDYDEDGDEDLMLIGDWMNITFLKNDGGAFNRDDTALSEEMFGLWKVAEVGDLDADGDLDVVIGNKGLNSTFSASATHPMYLYNNDFDNNGTLDPVVTRYVEDEIHPLPLQPEFVKQLPKLKSKFLRHSDYAGKSISDIFTHEELSQSQKLKLTHLEHVALINDGSGRFEVVRLPSQAQYSSIYALSLIPNDKGEGLDIVFGGNQLLAKPRYGADAASYMGICRYSSASDNISMLLKTGLMERGMIRDMENYKSGDDHYLIIGKNNDETKVYQY